MFCSLAQEPNDCQTYLHTHTHTNLISLAIRYAKQKNKIMKSSPHPSDPTWAYQHTANVCFHLPDVSDRVSRGMF